MNGIQLRRQILANTNTRLRQIPFVIWSSVVDPIDPIEMDELDIQALILKPNTYSQLLSTYDAMITRWGSEYDSMHCANTDKSRSLVLASLLPINLISSSAYIY